MKAMVNITGLVNNLGVTFEKYNHGSRHLSSEAVDVMYKGQRIAIVNGLSAALQWTAKNGSKVPIDVVVYIENQVIENIN